MTDVPVGKEAHITANTMAAGPGQAKLTVVSPSGQPVPATVEPVSDGFTGKFVPQELGPHSLSVSYAEQPIPGSPFHVTATQVCMPLNYSYYTLCHSALALHCQLKSDCSLPRL